MNQAPAHVTGQPESVMSNARAEGLTDQAATQYEVALEVLSVKRGELANRRREETDKANPNPEIIDYCTAEIATVNQQLRQLLPSDTTAVKGILTEAQHGKITR